ncbi:MAG TPA: carboxypeptidase-like regulatory domain-containing protein [Catenuloplanes sp.]|jgi:hypothetical protein
MGGIVEHQGTGDGRPTPEPDDAALLARLGEVIHRPEPVPPAAIELARGSFGLRTVDAELAALVGDSDVDEAVVAVRLGDPNAGPRLLTFEVGGADAAAIEVEISGAGRRHRLLGQLHPPGAARVELRQPGVPGTRSVTADDQGRFLIDDVDPGLFNLTCHRPGHRPVTTAWTGLR